MPHPILQYTICCNKTDVACTDFGWMDPSNISGQSRGGGGGAQGAGAPLPSPTSLSSDLLVLLNFNILLCFQPIFIQEHNKFTSKLQHFVEIEHFAVRKQQKNEAIAAIRGRVQHFARALCARI